MNDRGQYGIAPRRAVSWASCGLYRGRVLASIPRESVGISLFHTVGDRDRLVEQVDTELGQLIAELYRKMGGDPELFETREMLRDPGAWSARYRASQQVIRRSPIYPLWNDTVVPVWNEWKKFYKEQSSWEEWKTGWQTYENWRDRVAKLHGHVSSEVARLMPDQPVRTPSPTAAPKTIWAEAVEPLREGAGDVWKFVKIAAYGGLALGGGVVIMRLVQGLRGDR